MNQILKRALFPAGALLMGGVGAVLYQRMAETCFDELNLPIPGSGLTPLIVFCVAAALMSLLASLPFRSSKDWDSAFHNVVPFDFCLCAGGAGFLLSSILFLTQGEAVIEPSVFAYNGRLLPLMIAVGPLLAGAGLLFTSTGRPLLPAAMMTPCLASCFWLVNIYHSNANDPVVLHFAWFILAAASCTIAWYAVTGFAVGKGRFRPTLSFMLLSIVLCLTALPSAAYLFDKLLLVTQVICFSGLTLRLMGNVQYTMHNAQ